MTDVVDHASDIEPAQASPRRKTFSDSAVVCRICEAPIPIARRRAVPGVQTCADCQQELDYAVVSGGD